MHASRSIQIGDESLAPCGEPILPCNNVYPLCRLRLRDLEDVFFVLVSILSYIVYVFDNRKLKIILI